MVAFYKSPDEKVRPGDIVRLSPIFKRLKSVVAIGSPKETRPKPPPARVMATEYGTPGSRPIPAPVAQGSADAELVTPGHFGWAILLTRGCDVDHSRIRQVAPIYPLTKINTEDQVSVIEGRHGSMFYLPGSDVQSTAPFEESFVDLRFTLTIDQQIFDSLDRPIALTRDAILTLYLSWIKHIIGGNVPERTDCPECGASVPLYDVIETGATPPSDY